MRVCSPLSIFLLSDVYESLSVSYSSGVGLPDNTALCLMNSLEYHAFLLILFFASLLGSNRATKSETSNPGQ